MIFNADDPILEHFGVKGMKWGVRRGRNVRSPDGRTRYVAKPKTLTEDELIKRIKRMETEKRYNELNKKTVSTGQKLTSDIITTVGKNTLTMVGTAAAIYGIKKAIEAKFGDTVVKDMFPKKK